MSYYIRSVRPPSVDLFIRKLSLAFLAPILDLYKTIFIFSLSLSFYFSHFLKTLIHVRVYFLPGLANSLISLLIRKFFRDWSTSRLKSPLKHQRVPPTLPKSSTMRLMPY